MNLQEIKEKKKEKKMINNIKHHDANHAKGKNLDYEQLCTFFSTGLIEFDCEEPRVCEGIVLWEKYNFNYLTYNINPFSYCIIENLDALKKFQHRSDFYFYDKKHIFDEKDAEGKIIGKQIKNLYENIYKVRKLNDDELWTDFEDGLVFFEGTRKGFNFEDKFDFPTLGSLLQFGKYALLDYSVTTQLLAGLWCDIPDAERDEQQKLRVHFYFQEKYEREKSGFYLYAREEDK